MQLQGRIDFANTLRGVAAISVLIAHYFGAFWVGGTSVNALISAPVETAVQQTAPAYIYQLHRFVLLNWGAFWVALFFLVSGFVIPLSLKKMNRLEFSINRIFRIIPTYAVGFSVTLLSLFVSIQYHASEWPYTLNETLAHFVPGLRELLGGRNIDSIIWTLEIEIKFYILCGIALMAFRRYTMQVFLIPLLIFAITIYVNKFPQIAAAPFMLSQLLKSVEYASSYLIFMFIGVAFSYLYEGAIEPNKGYLLVGSVFALFCINWWLSSSLVPLFVAWSYGFAVLFFTGAYVFPQFFKANPVFDFFAAISYPLYVIHGILGYVALRILLDKGIPATGALFIVTTSVLGLAWILHVFIELPSQKLGRKALILTRPINP